MTGNLNLRWNLRLPSAPRSNVNANKRNRQMRKAREAKLYNDLAKNLDAEASKVLNQAYKAFTPQKRMELLMLRSQMRAHARNYRNKANRCRAAIKSM